jgi:hypothetical protein
VGAANQFTPAWLKKTMERRAEYAPHAAHLGERIRSYGGAAAAVEAISLWKEQRKP